MRVTISDGLRLYSVMRGSRALRFEQRSSWWLNLDLSKFRDKRDAKAHLHGENEFESEWLLNWGGFKNTIRMYGMNRIGEIAMKSGGFPQPQVERGAARAVEPQSHK